MSLNRNKRISTSTTSLNKLSQQSVKNQSTTKTKPNWDVSRETNNNNQ